METISVKEAFECIEKEKALILLFTLKDMTITPTMEQVCDLVRKHNDVVPLIHVEIDPETLTRDEAQRLSIMRVPQLRFYGNQALLGRLTGKISPSEVYEKILELYTDE